MHGTKLRKLVKDCGAASQKIDAAPSAPIPVPALYPTQYNSYKIKLTKNGVRVKKIVAFSYRVENCYIVNIPKEAYKNSFIPSCFLIVR
jgi:hypothetical protein